MYVPESVISRRRDEKGKSTPRAPVLVYFQDGAYVSGSKSDENPSSLIAASSEDGSSGIMYVGVNYRVRDPLLLSVDIRLHSSVAYLEMISTSWAYLDGYRVRSSDRQGAYLMPGCMMSVWRWNGCNGTSRSLAVIHRASPSWESRPVGARSRCN